MRNTISVVAILICCSTFMLSCKQSIISRTGSNIPQTYLNNIASCITESTWHTEGGSVFNDNYGDVSLPEISGLQWRVSIEGEVLCGPVIDSQGSIWCGITDGRLIQIKNGQVISDTMITQKKKNLLSITLDADHLYAVDDFSNLYRVNVKSAALHISSIPLQPNSIQVNAVAGLCVDPVSKAVFIDAVDGHTIGCNASTSHYWCKDLAEQHIGPPAVLPGGLSLMIGYSGNVVGIDENGETIVRTKITDAELYEIAYDPHNSIYYITSSNGIYCMNCNGTLLFNVNLQKVKRAPAICIDGSTVWSSSNGFIVSLDINGNMKWRRKICDEIWLRPSVDNDGKIYIADRRQTIYQISRDGDVLWSTSTTSNPWEMALHENEGLIVATRTTVEAYR